MVIITCREAKAVQYTAERLNQSLGNRRGGSKKKRSYSGSLVQSFHSSRRNPHASEQQVRSTQKSNFAVPPAQEISEQ